MLHWRITTLAVVALTVLGAFLGELDGFIWG
jgi:hypothetical protein